MNNDKITEIGVNGWLIRVRAIDLELEAALEATIHDVERLLDSSASGRMLRLKAEKEIN